MQTRIVDREMGEKGKHMPPGPRAVLKGDCGAPPQMKTPGGKRLAGHFSRIVVLPQVDESFEPIQDKWVLPGCAVLTTEQLRALARSRGWELEIVNHEMEAFA